MMELFNGALTLNQRLMRELRETPKAVQRGFLLILFVGMLVGAVNGIYNLVTNLSPERGLAMARTQVEELVDTIMRSPGLDGLQELVRVINENDEAFYQLVEEVLSLPQPLPRQLGLGFQLLAAIVSTPLSYLSSTLLAVVIAHLTARQLGGQGSLQQMVGLGSLSVAPRALDALAFIPQIGTTFWLIGWVWGCAILVVATMVAHKLDTSRALMAVLLYPLLLVLVGTLALCVLLAVVVSAAAGR